MTTPANLAIVVLLSGSGTTLQAILDAIANRTLPVTIKAVISNRAQAFGLERAAAAGVPTVVVEATDYPDRQAHEQALAACIDEYAPDLIALTGFMRILGPDFVRRFAGKLVNSHPSLLPKFPGLHTYQRVLDAGDTEHGSTLHFVTEELDGGPPILQGRVSVQAKDTVDSLQQRVKQLEHGMYPLCLRWFAEGRLSLSGCTVFLDKKPLGLQGANYEC